MAKIKYIIGICIFLLVVTGSLVFLFEKEAISISQIKEGKIFNVDKLKSIDLKPSKEETGTIETSSFKKLGIKQTEIDPNFPCYILNENTIRCEPNNVTQEKKLKESLSSFDKEEYLSKGIPVTNILGSAVNSKFIKTNETTEIKIDLSQPGEFKIGFNTNIFVVTSLSVGLYNHTTELGGDVFLSSGKTDGQYWGEIFDLNNTKTILNISFESSQPVGSDISVAVRSYNVSSTTGLFQDLVFYEKLDSGNLVDFSINNCTGTLERGATPTINGKFEGGVNLTNNDLIIMEGTTLYNGVMDDGNMTFSMWVKHDTISDTDQTYLSIRANSGNYRHIRRSTSSGTIRVYDNFDASSPNGANTPVTVITDTNWHNLVMVINGTDTNFYLDGSFLTKTTNQNSISGLLGDPDLFIGAFTATGTNNLEATIDELIFWNRTLSSSEVSDLWDLGALQNWSDFSTEFVSSPSDVAIDDGRFIQIKGRLTRTGAENVHLDNYTIGYGALGSGAPVDNPPVVSLDTPDLKVFGELNITFNASYTDDSNLVNATIYTNLSGTFLPNQTIPITGTFDSTEFSINNTYDTTALWNVLACDNSTAVQCSWALANRSFTIATICNDEDCTDGFLCNDATNECYTSCTEHNNCNSTYYCATNSTCSAGLPDTSDCFNEERSGLTDDEVCTSQILGFCFDDFTINQEWCTNDATGCVAGGTEFTQGQINCAIANDYYQCQGGESAWGSLVDCIDLGNDFDASASVSGHTYCGYYNAETCDGTGCVSPGTPTADCGDYYHTGSGICGTIASDCDVGCGASFDSDTCIAPNTLENNCSCTPPEVDEFPVVTLESPTDSSTSSSTSITFGYSVEDIGINNCDLYFLTDDISWHLNQTNSTTVSLSETNSFTSLTFQDFTNITWNVDCNDTSNQTAFAPSNFSVSIRTLNLLKFNIFNGSRLDKDIKVQFDERGFANITGLVSIGSGHSIGQFNISTGGLLVKTGNVGIGTASPSATLHVSTSDVTQPTWSSTPQFIVSATGGTTIPLDVSFASGNNANLTINLGDQNDENIGFIQYDHSLNSLKFGTNTAEKMIIDNAGNVGIGTASPSELFEVNLATTDSASDGPVISLIRTDAGVGGGEGLGQIVFKGTDGGTAVGARIFAESGGAHSGSSKRSDLVFEVTANGETVPTEVMRLLSDGNVGIGTISPSAKLDIDQTTNDEGIIIRSGNSAPEITFYDDDDDDSFAWNFNRGADSFRLEIDDVAKHAFTKGGFVGIGTTTPTHELNVVGDVNITGALGIGRATPDTKFGINASYSVGGANSGAIKGSALGGETAFGVLGYLDSVAPSVTYGVYGVQGSGDFAGYFDGNVFTTGKLISDNACGIHQSTFWAEESAALNTGVAGGKQFSYGNGVTGGNGITQPCPGTIVSTSMNCAISGSTNGRVQIMINGAAQGTGCQLETTGTGNAGFVDSSCSVSFSAADEIGFITTTTDATSDDCVPTMWVRYD